MTESTKFSSPKAYSNSRFDALLSQHNHQVTRHTVTTLQVNMGRRCNQICRHCHVEAGPERQENMDHATVDRVLALLKNTATIERVDITGGAPELNPHFRYFVAQIRAMGKEVIDRCNLTVLLEEGQADTADFLAGQQVQIIASLPCYLEENVNVQRGTGVFAKSITALTKLNTLGYGRPDTGLKLNLVHNPAGAYLPPDQTKLEADYKAYLYTQFGLVFNQLLTLTNMPIKRFAKVLEQQGQTNQYMHTLMDAFNVMTLPGLMCRQMVSVGWDGVIYDCDFNQMLEIPLRSSPKTLWDMESFASACGAIAFADHCFGCTAGTGSSCGGALLN